MILCSKFGRPRQPYLLDSVFNLENGFAEAVTAQELDMGFLSVISLGDLSPEKEQLSFYEGPFVNIRNNVDKIL
jgi:hypothetical protein